MDKKLVDQVFTDLRNKGDKIYVAQIAPAVRVAIGEYLGFEPGENVIDKLLGALRKMGVDYIFDTNFGADLTIIEEAAEFVQRLKTGKKLPLFTTCCPTWYSFVEKYYPEHLSYLSTVKSPQANLASIIKTHFRKSIDIPLENMVHFAIAPCVVKKDEAKIRKYWVYEEKDVPNIDFVLTTKETAELIKMFDINLNTIEEAEFNNPLGESSGAGAIFGTTGGVMEAVLRTAYFYLEDKELIDYELEEVRNTGLVREAKFKLGEYDLDVASFNSLKEVKPVLDKMRSNAGESKYHFVEVMACPLGCIGGAGQGASKDILMKRREALFKYDKKHKARSAHTNEYIKKLYDEYLGGIGSERAHELLHTQHEDRSHQDGENEVCELEFD